MGRLLILKKDSGVLADFQNAALFANFACAALHEDEHYYYVTLIPPTNSQPDDGKLMQRWQSYIVSTLTPVHGSSRQPSTNAAYQYDLKRYPIVNLSAVQEFYRKHHSQELDTFMLNYCRRYIDFDFIHAEQNSLFVFAKNIVSADKLPPINEYPGAEQFPDFLADLDELVTHHLQTPTKLTLLARLDNQSNAKQFSSGLFNRRQDATSANTRTTFSLQP